MTYGLFLSDEERVEKLVERLDCANAYIEKQSTIMQKERARLQHLRMEFVLLEERQRRANARRLFDYLFNTSIIAFTAFYVGAVLGSHCTMLFMR